MSTLKLLDEYPRRPEAVFLLDRVLRYVHSNTFAPETKLSRKYPEVMARYGDGRRLHLWDMKIVVEG
jgi:hypothetical protein